MKQTGEICRHLVAFGMAGAAALWTGSALAQQSDCVPEGTAFAEPLEKTPLMETYSDENEHVLVHDQSGVGHIDAQDGDDTIYVDGSEHHVGSVETGRGTDTVIVCNVHLPGIRVVFGDRRHFSADADPDLVILEPAVFAGASPDVLTEIAVVGFNQQNDRIKLRLPPGIDFEYRPYPSRLSIVARAGNVLISAKDVQTQRPAERSALEVERVDEWPQANTISLEAPVTGSSANDMCPSSDTAFEDWVLSAR